MYRITFFLGIECDGQGRQLMPDFRAEGVARVRRLLAAEYGGYTITHGAGGWLNGEHDIVEEAMLRLDCYIAPESGAKVPTRAEVDSVARRLGEILGQSAVLVEWARTDARMVAVPAAADAAVRRAA